MKTYTKIISILPIALSILAGCEETYTVGQVNKTPATSDCEENETECGEACCSEDEYCKNGDTCTTKVAICGSCTDSKECQVGECQSKVCVKTELTGDHQCIVSESPNVEGYCKGTSEAPCVQCYEDGDKTEGCNINEKCDHGKCVKECTQDDDCHDDGKYCKDSKCTPKVEYCGACTKGNECVSGYCNDNMCQIDDTRQCKIGDDIEGVCYENSCVQCYIDNGHIEGCNEDKACDNHTCIEPECGDEKACDDPDNQYCELGMCKAKKSECTSCNRAEECLSGHCNEYCVLNDTQNCDYHSNIGYCVEESALRVCKECPTIGAQTGCGDGNVCGNDYTCAVCDTYYQNVEDKQEINRSCMCDNQCKSGLCFGEAEERTCKDCVTPGSHEGCNDTTLNICGSENTCVACSEYGWNSDNQSPTTGACYCNEQCKEGDYCKTELDVFPGICTKKDSCGTTNNVRCTLWSASGTQSGYCCDGQCVTDASTFNGGACGCQLESNKCETYNMDCTSLGGTEFNACTTRDCTGKTMDQSCSGDSVTSGYCCTTGTTSTCVATGEQCGSCKPKTSTTEDTCSGHFDTCRPTSDNKSYTCVCDVDKCNLANGTCNQSNECVCGASQSMCGNTCCADGHCFNGTSCVVCMDSSQCTTTSKPYCNLSNHKCESCGTGIEFCAGVCCTSDKPYCNASGTGCVKCKGAQGCSSNDVCVNNECKDCNTNGKDETHCTGDNKYCKANSCVSCEVYFDTTGNEPYGTEVECSNQCKSGALQKSTSKCGCISGKTGTEAGCSQDQICDQNNQCVNNNVEICDVDIQDVNDAINVMLRMDENIPVSQEDKNQMAEKIIDCILGGNYGTIKNRIDSTLSLEQYDCIAICDNVSINKEAQIRIKDGASILGVHDGTLSMPDTETREKPLFINSSGFSNIKADVLALNLNLNSKLGNNMKGLIADEATDSNIILVNFTGKIKADMEATSDTGNIGGFFGKVTESLIYKNTINLKNDCKSIDTCDDKFHFWRSSDPRAKITNFGGFVGQIQSVIYANNTINGTIQYDNSVYFSGMGGHVGKSTNSQFYNIMDDKLNLVLNHVYDQISYHLGGIVGMAENSSFDKCYGNTITLEDKISSSAYPNYIGGIAGYYYIDNNSTIDFSKLANLSPSSIIINDKKSVDAPWYGNPKNCGGLFGYFVDARTIPNPITLTLSDSTNKFSIVNTQNMYMNVGGLIGSLENAELTIGKENDSLKLDTKIYTGCITDNCTWSTDNLFGVVGGENIGGIIGAISGGSLTLYNVDHQADWVSGESNVGGIIGYANNANITLKTVSNVLNKTAVSLSGFSGMGDDQELPGGDDTPSIIGVGDEPVILNPLHNLIGTFDQCPSSDPCIELNTVQDLGGIAEVIGFDADIQQIGDESGKLPKMVDLYNVFTKGLFVQDSIDKCKKAFSLAKQSNCSRDGITPFRCYANICEDSTYITACGLHSILEPICRWNSYDDMSVSLFYSYNGDDSDQASCGMTEPPACISTVPGS